jgi:hypothetical protein
MMSLEDPDGASSNPSYASEHLPPPPEFAARGIPRMPTQPQSATGPRKAVKVRVKKPELSGQTASLAVETP